MSLFRSAATPVLDPYAADLAAIHPSLRIRISARAKRLALRLDAKTGHVYLVLPKRASMKSALAFARQYQDWIERHAAREPDGIALGDGSVIPILGEERTIRVQHNPDIRRTTITLNDNELLVVTNQDDPGLRIARYLKTLAREEITRLANEKAAMIDKQINAITIRDTSTRWGSCSQDGNLSFSWRLILAPLSALDYVVAHEVAHLVHMNHKTRFWTLCEKLSADFSGGHGWMKKHGHNLMRYG
jgi:predicted metal-dependent hydrolase